MTTSRTVSSAKVEVIPAPPEQESILANLLELYSHDFSEFTDLKLGADGRFGYKHLPLYWKESNRYPFLIKAGGHLAGFVFVRRGSEVSHESEVWDVAEFFIARGLRRLGLGTRAAHEIWKKFPGRWEVRVMEQNREAQEFWRRAIDEYLGEAVEPIHLGENGRGWHVFSFESGRAA